MPHELNRRRFLSLGAAGAVAAGFLGSTVDAGDAHGSKYRICAFEKFLQDLSYEELADVIAELGFVGIEATVRNKGHVLPERVKRICRSSLRR